MINSELLNQAGINYEAGLERFLNDPELYEAVLTAFNDEDILERAEIAFQNQDQVQLLKVIHEAKGSSGNAGLDQLYAESSAFVVLLRSNSFSETELSDNYQRFAKVYTAIQNGIKAALGQ